MDLTHELRNFLDEDGRLKAYPAKRRMKLLALFYLASKFEPGRRYSEKQVNALLEGWHAFSDWVMLRRDLVDHGFLGREQDGSVYWMKETQPTPEDFGTAPRGPL